MLTFHVLNIKTSVAPADTGAAYRAAAAPITAPAPAAENLLHSLQFDTQKLVISYMQPLASPNMNMLRNTLLSDEPDNGGVGGPGASSFNEETVADAAAQLSATHIGSEIARSGGPSQRTITERETRQAAAGSLPDIANNDATRVGGSGQLRTDEEEVAELIKQLSPPYIETGSARSGERPESRQTENNRETLLVASTERAPTRENQAGSFDDARISGSGRLGTGGEEVAELIEQLSPTYIETESVRSGERQESQQTENHSVTLLVAAGSLSNAEATKSTTVGGSDKPHNIARAEAGAASSWQQASIKDASRRPVSGRPPLRLHGTVTG